MLLRNGKDVTNLPTIFDVDYLPIGYAEDGSSAPAAVSTLSSTNKVGIRDFDGASNETVKFMWMVPYDLVGATVKARLICYVSNSTAPATGEIVAFSVAGMSLANSGIISGSVGTAVTSSLTADATYAQYDRLATAWTSAITITGVAAGESAHLDVIRLATTTDTYAQDIGMAGLEIKYTRQLNYG